MPLRLQNRTEANPKRTAWHVGKLRLLARLAFPFGCDWGIEFSSQGKLRVLRLPFSTHQDEGESLHSTRSPYPFTASLHQSLSFPSSFRCVSISLMLSYEPPHLLPSLSLPLLFLPPFVFQLLGQTMSWRNYLAARFHNAQRCATFCSTLSKSVPAALSIHPEHTLPEALG